MAFDRNVFVNCPFDEEFYPLLRPLLFTIIYLGLKPRIALEDADSGQLRIDKIVQLVSESRYAIHDLSRIEAIKAGELYRLNMPYELGLDAGCRHFGTEQQRSKKSLVLEKESFRYKVAFSDLSGYDIASHGNDPIQVVFEVRNWLKAVCKVSASGPTKIWSAFTDFMANNFDTLSLDGFSPSQIEKLPIAELIEHMESWITKKAPTKSPTAHKG